ncbi:phycocyanin alpha phycocyanobilin lyase [Synechococcus sp. BS56D]|uniref:HEAT repeat domain-containing protein n=1 Tax=Synechococcus sp. BS56D TaxID=2055944 RepID=UPI0010F1BBE7|nr:HEAT repeat domain-containing protein [Synechococcus sp. BS56D]TCD56019.1 phycocyanin alpha phycocyanobilin lyase [Synechococcus sp. BS56D]
MNDSPSLTLESAIAQLEQASSAEDLIGATRHLAALAEPGAADSLMSVLAFNNPGAALAAVDGLIAIGPEAVPVILGNLDARNYGARAWAVRALAGLADERGLDVLVDVLLHDVGPSVRRAAARGLGELVLSQQPELAAAQLNSCVEALEVGSRDGEWVVRYAVVVGLERRMQTPEGKSDLRERITPTLKLLGDPQREPTLVVRQRAELSIQRLDCLNH